MKGVNWIQYNKEKEALIKKQFEKGASNECSHDWHNALAHDFDSDYVCYECGGRKNKKV